MNQINPATASGNTIANTINDISDRLGKVEVASQAMTMRPIPWYGRIPLAVKKYWNLLSLGFKNRQEIKFDAAISDQERRLLMRELQKEEDLLFLKRRLIHKRNFLTKIQEAHCITGVRLEVHYRHVSGSSDEVISDFKGQELALLIPVMNLPGLKVESTHPEDGRF